MVGALRFKCKFDACFIENKFTTQFSQKYNKNIILKVCNAKSQRFKPMACITEVLKGSSEISDYHFKGQCLNSFNEKLHLYFSPQEIFRKKTRFVGVDPTLRCPIYGHHSRTLIPSAISSYIHCICHFNLLILNYIFRYSIRRAIIYKKITKKILLRRELKTLKSVIDKRTQLLVPTQVIMQVW